MGGSGTLSDLLETSASRTPDGVAMRAGDDAWTFRELAEWSGRLAKGLVDAGARVGDRIALFMPNSGELVAGYWACFAAGLVPVPLNHRCIAADAGHAIGHSRSTVLIADPGLADRLSPLDWKELGVERRYLVGESRDGWAAFEQLVASEALEPVALGPSADALIMYTSGTTGNPKGVVYTHHGLRAIAEALRTGFGHSAGVVQLLPTPVSHIAGFTSVLAGALGGATTVVGASADPAVVLPLVERWRVELLKLLPTGLDDFVEADEHEHHDLSSLRAVAVAGDKVPMEVHHRFSDLAGFEATEYIGMTECSYYASNPAFGKKRLGSVGRPTVGHEIRVVDHDDADVAVGKTGQILVKSAGMFDRYLDNADATAETLRDGWLRTGDLGRLDADGWLWFMGRTKQVIIRAGSNVVPEEVEEILYQHPAVCLACVVGAPDPRLGQRVEAYVEPEHDASPLPSGEELRRFVADRVAGYKVPEHIFFVAELPRTGTGKLDRHKLETQVTSDLASA